MLPFVEGHEVAVRDLKHCQISLAEQDAVGDDVATQVDETTNSLDV